MQILISHDESTTFWWRSWPRLLASNTKGRLVGHCIGHSVLGGKSYFPQYLLYIHYCPIWPPEFIPGGRMVQSFDYWSRVKTVRLSRKQSCDEKNTQARTPCSTEVGETICKLIIKIMPSIWFAIVAVREVKVTNIIKIKMIIFSSIFSVFFFISTFFHF